ncbi:hypothetical protein [Kibdelosporangium philippinense]
MAAVPAKRSPDRCGRPSARLRPGVDGSAFVPVHADAAVSFAGG